jgi:predicted nucleic acid-binding protein
VTITAIDTNILIDLLEQDESLAEAAIQSIAALPDDYFVICEMVYAELANRFADRKALDEFLQETRVELTASSREALFRAGAAWVAYARGRPVGLACRNCGAHTVARCSKCEAVLAARQRILPDFYVAGHAAVDADRLLTRDKRHFQTYFPDLELV